MNGRTLSLVIGVLVLLALAVGAAGAIPQRLPPPSPAAGATVSGGISYQGRLSDADGAPLDGAYTMRFVIYDDPISGSSVWDSGDVSVTVENGLFTTTLDVDPKAFDGQALWLSIVVEDEILSPRQELLPAPYALGLRPGAEIVGESMSASNAVLAGRAPATGTALRAQANGGVGVFGTSDSNYGVRGASESSWGGYFTSDEGYGIRVDSAGEHIYDYGAYVTSNMGYGVYAQSAQNQALRGEAGDISGISQPLGAVGVVGIGQNRGIYGASSNGVGVYGSTNNNYAGYFYSSNYRGLYARSTSGYYAGYFTNQGGSTQPGMYVNGTLTVTGSKTGYVVDVCLNEGPEPLEVGDVVAVVGVGDPVVGEIPVMRVVKATAENASAVVGVVDQRFVVDEESGESIARPDTAVPQLDADNGIQPGEYVSVVTLGAFKLIKVDAGFGAIQPGDLLTPSPNAGYAMRAGEPIPGTIIGKALDGLETGQGVIAVYVTMQ